MNIYLTRHFIEVIHLLTDEVDGLQTELRKQKAINVDLLRVVQANAIEAEERAEAERTASTVTGATNE
jgi:hypothetical protein